MSVNCECCGRDLINEDHQADCLAVRNGIPLTRFEGNGGNITFKPGKGTTLTKLGPPVFDGSIIFLQADEKEMLRLGPDGKCYVRGEEVASNKAVFEAFVAWLVEDVGLPIPGKAST